MNGDPDHFIESLVLSIHRRNGGSLTRLDFKMRLMDPLLELDSLDLAEIMAGIEKAFGRSPFDAPRPPRTWDELKGTLL